MQAQAHRQAGSQAGTQAGKKADRNEMVEMETTQVRSDNSKAARYAPLGA